MKLRLASSLIALSVVYSAVTFAKTPSENTIDLQSAAVIYTPSQLVEKDGMSFPFSAERDKMEGYIEVIYDVSKAGRAVNLRYNRVSGTEIFETIIENNLEDWVFEPANIDGTPIVQRNQRQVFTFTLTKLANKFPEPLMRRNFAKAYLKMRELLKEEDFEELDKFVTTMKKSNIIRFSENRKLAVLLFTILEKTGGSLQDQILELEKALKDSPRTEKTEKLNAKIKSMLFKKYLENNQYFQALIQYNDLSKSKFSEDLLAPLAPKLEEARAILRSDKAISSTLKVDASEMLSHYLSRRVFTIDSDTDISFSELRCGEFNANFKHIKNSTYQLPFDWNNCSLVLSAAQGSLITVSESTIYDSL